MSEVAGINLLPWREERRLERDRKMLSTGIFILLACAVAVFAVLSYYGDREDYQNHRNRYLDTAIKELDKEIEEIRELEAQRENLIARMQVIQDLQQERTQIVHLFDDIVRKLPEGVHFQSLSKKGKMFLLQGTAQSNARVSNLMRALQESPWFTNPDLEVIDITPSEGVHMSKFKLNVSEETAPQKSSEDAPDQAADAAAAAAN